MHAKKLYCKNMLFKILMQAYPVVSDQLFFYSMLLPSFEPWWKANKISNKDFDTLIIFWHECVSFWIRTKYNIIFRGYHAWSVYSHYHECEPFCGLIRCLQWKSWFVHCLHHGHGEPPWLIRISSFIIIIYFEFVV